MIELEFLLLKKPTMLTEKTSQKLGRSNKQ